MLEGYRGGQVFKFVQQLHGGGRGNMFHADSKPGEARGQITVNIQEFGLPVHHEAVAFAMHQQRNIHFLHDGQGSFRILHGLHSALAVRGGPCRVQLDAEHQFLEPGQFLLGIGTEKCRHVRLEHIVSASVQHPLPVSLYRIRISHRRHQVGHDDRSGKRGGT